MVPYKLNQAVKDIVYLCLQFESQQINVTTFSLYLSARLDSCRNEIEQYIKDTTLIWPAELVTIVRRINRTGIKNDLIYKLQKTNLEAAKEAMLRLKSKGNDVAEIERSLKARYKAVGVDYDTF